MSILLALWPCLALEHPLQLQLYHFTASCHHYLFHSFFVCKQFNMPMLVCSTEVWPAWCRRSDGVGDTWPLHARMWGMRGGIVRDLTTCTRMHTYTHPLFISSLFRAGLFTTTYNVLHSSSYQKHVNAGGRNPQIREFIFLGGGGGGYTGSFKIMLIISLWELDPVSARLLQVHHYIIYFHHWPLTTNNAILWAVLCRMYTYRTCWYHYLLINIHSALQLNCQSNAIQ